MAAIKVTIIEDHKGILLGLQQLIDNTPGYSVVGAYPSCKDILKKIEKSMPDVVLMDIQLPDISGIEGVQIIKEKYPEVRIVMQTVFEDDDKIFAAICAGASGYLLKNSTPLRYLQAIEEVFHGGAPMSVNIASRVLHIFKEMGGRPDTHHETLSEREKEVLNHLVKGLSYKQIAAECHISYDTVRFHMKNIYAKLHVTSMTEAVAKAILHKLV
jgi:DNA-binding NarL/FixJ family response regulator